MQNYIKNLEKVFIVRNAAGTKSGMLLIDEVKPKIMKKRKFIKAYEKATGTKTEWWKLHSFTPEKGYRTICVDVLVTDNKLAVPVMEEVEKGIFVFTGKSIRALQSEEYLL